MDKVRKAFRQAPPDVARKVMEAYQCICAGDETGLDIKKMRGHKEMYRLRIGNWRLIYGKFKTGNEILSFGKRDDQTYRDF